MPKTSENDYPKTKISHHSNNRPKSSKKTSKKKSSSKKTSKKTSKKLSVKISKKISRKISKKTSTKKSKTMENQTEKSNGNSDTLHLQNIEEKAKVVSRNLLRLYQFLQMDKPIKEQILINELEFGTPNEEMRSKLMQIELELQSVYEENQALRQSALQIQIEAEDNLESLKIENENLENKAKSIDNHIKKELTEVENKYQNTIKELKKELRSSLEKNKEFSAVNDGINNLQTKLITLFNQNESLENSLSDLKKEKDSIAEKLEDSLSKIKKLKKKNADLIKKVDLQKLVIDGYKRKDNPDDKAD